MKRSKTVRLVLVTSVLVSCNRGVEPASGFKPDWVYVTGYPYPYLTNRCDSTVLYQQILPREYYDQWFYVGRAVLISKTPVIMKGSVSRSTNIVIRGGFGGHGFASS